MQKQKENPHMYNSAYGKNEDIPTFQVEYFPNKVKLDINNNLSSDKNIKQALNSISNKKFASRGNGTIVYNNDNTNNNSIVGNNPNSNNNRSKSKVNNNTNINTNQVNKEININKSSLQNSIVVEENNNKASNNHNTNNNNNKDLDYNNDNKLDDTRIEYKRQTRS